MTTPLETETTALVQVLRDQGKAAAAAAFADRARMLKGWEARALRDAFQAAATAEGLL